MTSVDRGQAHGSATIRHPTDPAYLRDLFNNSARYYESVNTITSLGQAVFWRQEVVRAASLRPGDRVLDAFCGPGGLAATALPYLDSRGELVLADLSPVMLHEARKRLAREALGDARGAGARRGVRRRAGGLAAEGRRPRIEFVAGDLLRDDLGLRDFDAVFVGWGLRYVEDVDASLSRVGSFLRLGGRLVVLEFTRPPRVSWATPAHLYFRYVLPRIGSWLARDRELHEYLSVSAAEFLSARELVAATGRAGLAVRSCRSHLDGLVTIVAADAR